MLPDSVRTSSELLQPSISHPSLSTHIFWHERSSAEKKKEERREEERGGEEKKKQFSKDQTQRWSVISLEISRSEIVVSSVEAQLSS